MIPILYPPDERVFDNNGLGVLVAAASCTVSQKINAAPELEMQYPMEGKYYPQLRRRCIILAQPGPGEEPQPFRIYRASKRAPGLITFYARHLCYDLKGIPTAPFRASNAPAAMSALKNNAAVDCPFIFSTDKTTEADMHLSVPQSIWETLGGTQGSVLDTYGGEYQFDRFNVRLQKRLGHDRGVEIRYGKNLTSLEQDENCENTYTGAYPYWTNGEETLVELPEKILAASGSFDHVRILPLDLSQEFEDAPTVQQLRDKAAAVMKSREIGVPAVSLTVSFVPLAQTAEYRDRAILETVSLGDDVAVYFPKMEVTAQARVVQTEYDVLAKRYKSVTLGRVKEHIAKTIADNKNKAQENSDKIYVESQKRKSEDEKLSAELTIQGGKIEAKVDQLGGDPASCSWEMVPRNFILRFDGKEVLVVKKGLFRFEGIIEAQGGHIGGLEIGADSLSFGGLTWGGSVSNGLYLGPQGIQLGNAQLGIDGWVDIHDGKFRGNTNAGKIRYGDDYGSFSGEGLSTHTVSGSRMKYSTISTDYTNSGINTSLGFADYANGVFNGWNEADTLKTGSLKLDGHYLNRASIQIDGTSHKLVTWI